MTYTGRCNCGAITATITAEPLWVRQCWCRQCQKIAAGAATTNALFPVAAIELQGELAWATYQAASGNTVEHGFCAKCGTQVTGRNSARPEANVVRVGFIEQPNDLAPSIAIWLDEAPRWATIDPALETFAGQPPHPAPAPTER